MRACMHVCVKEEYTGVSTTGYAGSSSGSLEVRVNLSQTPSVGHMSLPQVVVINTTVRELRADEEKRERTVHKRCNES